MPGWDGPGGPRPQSAAAQRQRLLDWLQKDSRSSLVKRPRGTYVGPGGWKAHFQRVPRHCDGGRLGEGSFGVVWRCRRTTQWPSGCPSGELVAVKVVDTRKASFLCPNEWSYHIATEVAVLRNLLHPNIPALYDVLYSNDHIYMAMEYLEGYRELYEYITKRPVRVTPDEARTVGGQLLVTLAFLHYYGIVHRDLKPENMLISPSSLVLKVLDFGLAKHVGTPSGQMPDISPVQPRPSGVDPFANPGAHVHLTRPVSMTPVGTELYAPREMLSGRGAREQCKWQAQGYTACKVDVHSAGVVLYAMLFLSLPFYDDDVWEKLPHAARAACVRGLQQEGLIFPECAARTPRCVLDLIQAMLHLQPELRPSARECMAGEWMQGFRHPLGDKAGELPPEEPTGPLPFPPNGDCGATALAALTALTALSTAAGPPPALLPCPTPLPCSPVPGLRFAVADGAGGTPQHSPLVRAEWNRIVINADRYLVPAERDWPEADAEDEQGDASGDDEMVASAFYD